MGKGDKKTRRGKITKGSYGKHRLRKRKNQDKYVVPKEIIEVKAEEVVEEKKTTTKKKAAAPKKTVAKKTTTAKKTTKAATTKKTVAKKKITKETEAEA